MTMIEDFSNTPIRAGGRAGGGGCRRFSFIRGPASGYSYRRVQSRLFSLFIYFQDFDCRGAKSFHGGIRKDMPIFY